MNRSNGMGIEMPKWVITTRSNSKFYNVKSGKFEKDVSEKCLFDSPIDANEKLKDLDFGFVVKSARHYFDMENSHITVPL